MGRLCAALVLFAAAATPASAANGPDAAAAEVLAEGRYQTTLPEASAVDSSEADRRPDFGGGPIETRRDGSYGGGPAPAARGSGGIPSWVPWILFAGAGAALAVVVLARFLGARTGAAGGAPPTAVVRATAGAPGDAPVEDHVRLAESGAYEAAVHSILLLLLADLAARARGGLPAALTSREILSRFAGGPAAAPLREIAALVEASRFGGRPLGRADYDRAAAGLAAWRAARPAEGEAA